MTVYLIITSILWIIGLIINIPAREMSVYKEDKYSYSIAIMVGAILLIWSITLLLNGN